MRRGTESGRGRAVWLALAAAGLLSIAGAAWWLWDHDAGPTSRRPAGPGRAGAAGAEIAGGERLAPIDDDAARSLSPGGGSERTSTLPEDATFVRFVGRVVDDAGAPLSGARVLVVPDGSTSARRSIPERLSKALAPAQVHRLAQGVTDAAGRFRVDDLRVAEDRQVRDEAQRHPRLVVSARGRVTQVFPLEDVDPEAARVDAGTLVLRLHTATVRLRVTDASGATVEGAACRASDWGPPGADAMDPALAAVLDGDVRPDAPIITDADGRARVEDLWPGAFTLSVGHPGFLPRALELTARPGDDLGTLEVVLDRGAAVAGTVRDADGRAVEDAELRARPANSAVAATVDPEQQAALVRPWGLHAAGAPSETTDAGGRFRITGLTTTSADLFVDAPGFEPVVVAGVPTDGPDVVVVLERAAIATVHVVDGDTGLPATGATLAAFRLQPPDPAGRIARTPTVVRPVPDAPASFEVVGLSRHATELVAAADGAPPTTVTLDGVSPGARVERTVELDSGGALVGRTVDAAGAPVADVELEFHPALELRPAPAPVRTRSAHDGRFVLAGLEPGTGVLRVRKPGYEWHDDRAIEVPAGVVDLGDVVMESACSIAGTVRDTDGSPAHGAVLWFRGVRDDGSGQAVSFRATSDAAGRYQCGNLPAGPVEVTADRMDPVVVELVRGEPRALDLRLRARPAVTGVVTAAGAPVADAVVVASAPGSGRPLRTSTDADGRYRIGLASFEEGTVLDVRAYAPGGGRSGVVAWTPAWDVTEVVDLALGGASISGRLVLPDGGRPDPELLAAIELLVETESDSPLAPREAVRASPDGAFLVSGLAPGSCELSAQGGGMEPVRLGPWTFAPDEAREDVVVEVVAGAVLDIETYEADGRQEDHTLFVHRPGVPDSLRTVQAGGGTATVDGLPPGTWRVASWSRDYAAAVRSGATPPTPKVARDVVLERSGRASVRLDYP